MVKALMSTSSFKQVQQSNPDSSFLLNDNGGVAMLCWQIKESVNVTSV